MSDKSGEWRPIETMPRTGEMVLMWSLNEGFFVGNWPQGCAPGEWRKIDGEWRGAADGIAQAATHWRHLPEQPVRTFDNTDPATDSVRTAILAAADTIASLPPLLPGPVSIPLMKADGNLRVAMHAVDLWEASLRANEQVPE